MRISDWSSDVCSSDLDRDAERRADAEAIADIGIVAGELAIGIEPALGVARIRLDLEVRGRVPFEVEAGLVGFAIRAIGSRAELGLAAVLGVIEHGAVLV